MTATQKKKIFDSIKNVFSGEIGGKYKITISLSESSSSSEGYILVKDHTSADSKSGCKTVKRACAVGGRIYMTLTEMNAWNGARVIAHEFGHLLGMDDKYINDPDKPGFTKPETPFWRETLMGDVGPLTYKDLDQIYK